MNKMHVKLYLELAKFTINIRYHYYKGTNYAIL